MAHCIDKKVTPLLSTGQILESSDLKMVLNQDDLVNEKILFFLK